MQLLTEYADAKVKYDDLNSQNETAITEEKTAAKEKSNASRVHQ